MHTCIKQIDFVKDYIFRSKKWYANYQNGLILKPKWYSQIVFLKSVFQNILFDMREQLPIGDCFFHISKGG